MHLLFLDESGQIDQGGLFALGPITSTSDGYRMYGCPPCGSLARIRAIARQQLGKQ